MKKISVLVLAGLILLSCLVGCADESGLTPNDPVTLTMWHVYGSQTESPLNDSINEFNRTVGREKGIVVNVVSVSSSSEIDEALTTAAKNTPGAPSLPDLFTAYPRVAEIIGHENLLDWSKYFTEAELSEFVDEFIEEGYFEEKLLMMPIAKSTELLFLNQTLFDRFAVENELDTNALTSFEGLFSACKSFYTWSNGRDMFQINDLYHYFLTGMEANGETLIENGRLNLDADSFKKVWEPMASAGIYGGLCLGNGYASDRWKTGEVISNVGSTAGILYLRDYVTYPDSTTEDIETSILPYPIFENGKAVTVHRGGGLFALKNEDERKNEAASVFAKWITEANNNLDFVTSAGYLPVKREAFDGLPDITDGIENEKYRLLYSTVNGMSDEYTYCDIPLFEGASDTQSAFEKNVKSVLNKAHAEYLDRVSPGENTEAVLNELITDSLEELQALYD